MIKIKNKKNSVIKYLSFGLKSKSGINNAGRKTFLHKINKTKKRYRIIDFYKFYKKDIAIVLKIEYDPNRTAPIALICYKTGILSYILACDGIKIGMFINPALFSLGSTQFLKNLSPGILISNIEASKSFGAKYIRAAGCYGIITTELNNFSVIKFPSGIERLICKNNLAVIGRIGNINHYLNKNKKASDTLYKLGKKPIVRGVAKNAVDHPHGGGRGRTSNLATALNFTGKVKKGVISANTKRKNYIYK
tara:strand:+ start:11869 stop:12618 length:750 start_codon:yes stop_codon:yes gene_type:complete